MQKVRDIKGARKMEYEIICFCLISGLVISGGEPSDSVGQSVEVYGRLPSTTRLAMRRISLLYRRADMTTAAAATTIMMARRSVFNIN